MLPPTRTAAATAGYVNLPPLQTKGESAASSLDPPAATATAASAGALCPNPQGLHDPAYKNAAAISGSSPQKFIVHRGTTQNFIVPTEAGLALANSSSSDGRCTGASVQTQNFIVPTEAGLLAHHAREAGTGAAGEERADALYTNVRLGRVERSDSFC